MVKLGAIYIYIIILKWYNIDILDDKPDYKDQILLSLKMDYNSIDNMIRAGYTKEMLENAVSVLERNGYDVDLENGIIKKKTM